MRVCLALRLAGLCIWASASPRFLSWTLFHVCIPLPTNLPSNLTPIMPVLNTRCLPSAQQQKQAHCTHAHCLLCNPANNAPPLPAAKYGSYFCRPHTTGEAASVQGIVTEYVRTHDSPTSVLCEEQALQVG